MMHVHHGGKNREMVGFNRRTFAMWLATIETSRMADADKAKKIALYQCEAADALDRHFFGPPAVETEPTGTELALRHAKLMVGVLERQAEMDRRLTIQENRTLDAQISIQDAYISGAMAMVVARTAVDIASSCPEVEVAGEILEGLTRLPGYPLWKSAAQIRSLVQSDPENYAQLRYALLNWSRTGDLPSPRVIGIRLKAMKGRILNGKFLAKQISQGTHLYRVQSSATFLAIA